MTFTNPIFDTLCDLNVCDAGSVTRLQSYVRDRNDIDVLQCTRSGVIFLSSTDHIDLSHYNNKPPTHRFGTDKRAIITTNDDTERRFKTFANLVRGKRWLDVGAGSGAVLDRLGPLSSVCAAVEPQETAAGFLKELGHTVYRRLEDVPNANFNIITLFHVFEHIQAPVELLRNLRSKLAEGGRLIIEVPHARDFLISFVDCQAFRDHTFWSEHLILHTRQSLAALLEAGGFHVHSISGVHRYPLANALHWLDTGTPGGHEAWSALTDENLDTAWSHVLGRLDLTDTLVAEARATQEALE